MVTTLIIPVVMMILMAEVTLLDSVITLYITGPVSHMPLPTCSSKSSASVRLNHQEDSLNALVK